MNALCTHTTYRLKIVNDLFPVIDAFFKSRKWKSYKSGLFRKRYHTCLLPYLPNFTFLTLPFLPCPACTSLHYTTLHDKCAMCTIPFHTALHRSTTSIHIRPDRTALHYTVLYPIRYPTVYSTLSFFTLPSLSFLLSFLTYLLTYFTYYIITDLLY